MFSFEDFKDRMYDDSDMDVTENIPDPNAKNPLELLVDNTTQEVLARLIERAA